MYIVVEDEVYYTYKLGCTMVKRIISPLFQLLIFPLYLPTILSLTRALEGSTRHKYSCSVYFFVTHIT